MNLYYVYYFLNLDTKTIIKYHFLLTEINQILKNHQLFFNKNDSIILYLHLNKLFTRFETNQLLTNYPLNLKINTHNLLIAKKIMNLLVSYFNKNTTTIETLLLATHLNIIIN